eukprot:TRINITY_DN80950_c0_g1_i2.p1 TRINITY_DN80950_c0_g1~~TRINITY_DN80950_c0_g1_i2.p1  ORF type:complete len:266 (-),score=-3.65 TRINITY_DN80950_c0_g1_i2:146-832(-)
MYDIVLKMSIDMYQLICIKVLQVQHINLNTVRTRYLNLILLSLKFIDYRGNRILKQRRNVQVDVHIRLLILLSFVLRNRIQEQVSIMQINKRKLMFQFECDRYNFKMKSYVRQVIQGIYVCTLISTICESQVDIHEYFLSFYLRWYFVVNCRASLKKIDCKNIFFGGDTFPLSRLIEKIKKNENRGINECWNKQLNVQFFFFFEVRCFIAVRVWYVSVGVDLVIRVRW